MKRDKEIKIRVSSTELTHIKNRAEKAGMNVSRFIRDIASSGRIIFYDMNGIYGLNSAVKGAARNINQVAKVVNSEGSVFAKDIDDLKENTRTINKKLQLIYELLEPREV